jgi:zinc and cadmium transporter
MGVIQYASLSMVLLLLGAGGASLLVQSARKKLLLDLLAFSGAYLFGILVMELLPVIFHEGHHTAGILFLVGFFVQLGMDFWTRGIEHGHLHIPAADKKLTVFTLFAGLGIHALMDGLPFAGIHSTIMESNHTIYSGILLHKIAEGFTLLLIMDMMGFKLIKSWAYILCFSLITPISIVIIQQMPFLLTHVPLVLGFAGGSLLHVSITILFESENLHHHGIPVRKLISIGLGLILSILIALG